MCVAPNDNRETTGFIYSFDVTNACPRIISEWVSIKKKSGQPCRCAPTCLFFLAREHRDYRRKKRRTDRHGTRT